MKKVGVILSTGERTEAYCKHLMSKQMSDLVVVKGYGRAEAIKEAYKIGAEQDVMILIAADCLILPGVVDKLIAGMGDYDRVSGWCYDKFRGKELGGVICYNAKFLPKALENWPKFKNDMRPESRLIKALGSYTILPIDTALHEYELDYKELYDKYVFTKQKYPDVMKLLPVFRAKAKTDDDYKAVIQALDGAPFSMGKKGRMKPYVTLTKMYKL